MAVLKAAERNALPGSTFAGPHRSFPIPDENHARAALSMAHNAADPSEIRAAVHRKFPEVGARAMGGSVSAGQPYMVGEKGPELMVPHQHGSIVPHHAMKKQMVRDLIGKMLMQGGKGTQPEQQPGTATVAGVQK